MRNAGRIGWAAAALALASLFGADLAMARGGGGGRGGGGTRGGAAGRNASSRLRSRDTKKKDPKALEAEREKLRQLDFRDADAAEDRGSL
jgi:hypothetical protein